jgi:hypothetical protein
MVNGAMLWQASPRALQIHHAKRLPVIRIDFGYMQLSSKVPVCNLLSGLTIRNPNASIMVNGAVLCCKEAQATQALQDSSHKHLPDHPGLITFGWHLAMC